MICIGHSCDVCKNQLEDLKDGWIPVCKAFPDGIPKEYFNMKPSELTDCGNGYHFVSDESDTYYWYKDVGIL